MNLSFPHDKNSLSFSKGTEKPWALTLLVLVATAIRLYSLSVTEIINPDGTLYINQARAIAMGDWSAVFTIHPYLSNYSILIRIFHLVIPEWLLAAHAVSIAFGSLAMIPLYGLFRQFFRHDESLATTTALAFLPTWVFNSIDIVRDPVSWFFSLYGLYWLIKGLKNNKKYLLPISCLAFLFAAWARIEALIYPTACLMLPVFFQRYRKNFFWFYLPILAGLAILFLLPVIDKDLLLKVSRVDSFINTIIKIITSGLPQYTEIRKAIPSIISPDQGKLIFSFLAEARSFIWLIALGVVGNRLFEAFSYPYTLIALFGITIFIRNSKDRALSIFLILLPFAALTALYIRTFQVWVIEYRYMMLVILPGSLCFCAGISSLSTKIEKRFGCSRLIALTSLTLLLVLSTLPKNLHPRGDSESVLKEIGQFLDSHHPPGNEITIAASGHTLRVVHLYANQYRDESYFYNEKKLLYPVNLNRSDSSPDELLHRLHKNNINYLLWEKNNIPKNYSPKLEGKVTPEGFKEIGRWKHHQAGNIIVYQVSNSKD